MSCRMHFGGHADQVTSSNNCEPETDLERNTSSGKDKVGKHVEQSDNYQCAESRTHTAAPFYLGYQKNVQR
jgi:hypothetical protein